MSSLGAPVALRVLGVLRPTGAVPEIPRRARHDQLTAPPALDLAPSHSRRPRSPLELMRRPVLRLVRTLMHSAPRPAARPATVQARRHRPDPETTNATGPQGHR